MTAACLSLIAKSESARRIHLQRWQKNEEELPGWPLIDEAISYLEESLIESRDYEAIEWLRSRVRIYSPEDVGVITDWDS
jgi:hypothetical protein